jgi:hypothetical protein
MASPSARASPARFSAAMYAWYQDFKQTVMRAGE